MRPQPISTSSSPIRRRARDTIGKQGFTVFESEWWHFDYRDWKSYALQNAPFEKLR